MDRPVDGSWRCAVNTLESDAAFSGDGQYRWWLRRRWNSGRRRLLFIGLNPSAADQRRDDPTLRRLLGFAGGWGYSELIVLNLYARVSRSPSTLLRVQDPIGPANDPLLAGWGDRWAEDAAMDLWCGWGCFGGRMHRDRQVISLLRPALARRRSRHRKSEGPLCIGLTQAGHPRHPLYASGRLRLRPLHWAASGSIRHPEETPPAPNTL